jgi:lipoprotein-releasing system permease protein
MFELSIALKYLIPGKKRLATSLISLMSIIVISLVVWLVLVFLSVINGIEKNWINKLTSLNAPLRITPTDQYYTSYYYLSDSLSIESDYNNKNIKEKLTSLNSNPYRCEKDMEIPASWPSPHLNKQGELVDPVKKVSDILSNHKNIIYEDYELSSALMKIAINHDDKLSFLTQMTYITSICEKNPNLIKLILPLSKEDLNHFFNTLSKQDLEQIKSQTSVNPLLSFRLDGNIEPIFLPKALKDSGVRIGDKGYFSYSKSSSFTNQEQHLPIYVAGFYDPGILPIGNRCVLAFPSVTSIINKAVITFSPDGTPINGIYVWFNDIFKAKEWKNKLQKEFSQAEIANYWKINDFSEYEFSKDMLQQFQSDKTIFTLIAIIILLVACSNIISLLIILVNDKKKEIATLQAMGASKKSIALIFGMCGIVTGIISCLIGVCLAIFTLHHLDSLTAFLSLIQGHAAFNAAFFGSHLPNTLSIEALYFILIATPLISLIAGIIPAIKAAKLCPSNVLRSE